MRKARVRVVRDVTSRSVEPAGVVTWRAGSEHVMFQWDRKPGLPPASSSWWTDFDIDGAHIIAGGDAEVLQILEERPDEGEGRLGC